MIPICILGVYTSGSYIPNSGTLIFDGSVNQKHYGNCVNSTWPGMFPAPT